MKVGYLRKKSFFTRFLAHRTGERKRGEKTLLFGRFGLKKKIFAKHVNNYSALRYKTVMNKDAIFIVFQLKPQKP